MKCHITNISIKEYIEDAGIVDEYDINQDDIIRIVIEKADTNNEFVFSGKLKDQSDYTILKTITGNANTTLIINTYDLLKIECTVYDTTDNHVLLVVRGFDG